MYLFIGVKYQGRRNSDSLNMRAAYRKMPAAGWKWTGVSELGICIFDVAISKLECSDHVIDTPPVHAFTMPLKIRKRRILVLRYGKNTMATEEFLKALNQYLL